VVRARYGSACELLVMGVVAAPVAVLARSDAYVARVGDETGQGLSEALTTWFEAVGV